MTVLGGRVCGVAVGNSPIRIRAAWWRSDAPLSDGMAWSWQPSFAHGPVVSGFEMAGS